MNIYVLLVLLIAGGIWQYRRGGWPPRPIVTPLWKFLLGVVLVSAFCFGSLVWMTSEVIQKHVTAFTAGVVSLSIVQLAVFWFLAKKPLTKFSVVVLASLPLLILTISRLETGDFLPDALFGSWILVILGSGISALVIILRERQRTDPPG